MPEEVLGSDRGCVKFPREDKKALDYRPALTRHFLVDWPLGQAPSAYAMWVPYKGWKNRSSGRGFGLAGSPVALPGVTMSPEPLLDEESLQAGTIIKSSLHNLFQMSAKWTAKPPITQFYISVCFHENQIHMLGSLTHQAYGWISPSKASPGAQEPLRPRGPVPYLPVYTAVKHGSHGSKVRVEGLRSEAPGSGLPGPHELCSYSEPQWAS